MSVQSVLVVDEAPAIRELLGLALQEQGFVVHTAASFAEALDLCRTHRPTVALVEADLFSARDVQSLILLKTAAPGMKLCVASASGGDSSVEDLRSLGIEHVFAKPFTLKHLLSVLERLASDP